MEPPRECGGFLDSIFYMSKQEQIFYNVYKKNTYTKKLLPTKRESVLDRIANREYAMDILLKWNTFNWKHSQRRKKFKRVKFILNKIMNTGFSKR